MFGRLSTISGFREPIRRSERGWRASCRVEGAAQLYQRLMVADPAAARRILPGNARRVVRALEVIELTGGPFSAVLPARRYLLHRCRADRSRHRSGRRSMIGLLPG